MEEIFRIDPVNPLGAVPQSVLSGYDGAGNLVSAQYPGLEQFLMTPDSLNRPRTIRQGGQTLAEYRYVGPHRVERRDLGNGVRTTFAYDAVRRMVESRHQAGLGTGTIVDHRSYDWDEMFNKIQRKDLRAGGPQKVHDYEYDPANRLTKTTVTDPAHPNPLEPLRQTTYLLDGVHNRREVQGSPDPAQHVGLYFQDSTLPEPADLQMNQYTFSPMGEHFHDSNGNLIERAGPQQWAMITYDYRNQMVRYEDLHANRVHTYAYDAFGRRVAKIVDAQAPGGGTETRFFYGGPDQWQVYEEQDAAGNTLATYVYLQSSSTCRIVKWISRDLFLKACQGRLRGVDSSRIFLCGDYH